MSPSHSEAPNPGWYPQSHSPAIAHAYARLQKMLTDKGYNLPDTMDPRGHNAVEAKTVKCLFEIVDSFSDVFPRILSDLIPKDQPKVLGLRERFIAPNWQNEVSHQAKHEEAGKPIREERERLRCAEQKTAQTQSAGLAGGVDETERGFEQAKRLEQEARDALFRELGGGDDMLQALLQMDDEASQVSVDRGERGRDSSAEASNGVGEEHTETRISFTKRSGTKAMIGSPPKKPRVDDHASVTIGGGDCVAFSLASRLSHPWNRTNSNGSSSVLTDNTSTTVSDLSTAQTTPTTTDEPLYTETSTWTPRPSLPVAERDALIIPLDPHQGELNNRDIPFYVQWEMSRHVNKHATVSWTDMTAQDFDFFRQPDSALCIVAWLSDIASRKAGSNTRGSTPTSSRECLSARRRRLLAELQREEESICENDLRGVLNADPSWSYGGKVAFVITVTPGTARSSGKITLLGLSGFKPLEKNPFLDGADAMPANTLPFVMTLNPPDMPGKSFRLARRFGSRRVIQFRLKDFKSAAAKSELMNLFIGRRFWLFGRSYRALWSPPNRDSVFAIETPEGYRGNDPAMPSFSEILAMYNNMESKPSQAVAKWAARPQILFSDSVPAVRLRPGAIGTAPDIVSSQATCYKEATTEQTLTDGCGLMSQSLARRLRPSGSGPPSSAVQIRLSGSKGMLAVMSDDQERQNPGMDVILRDSMVKALPDFRFADDPSLLTVDVLRYDSLSIGTDLTSESIVAMHHGGVPAETLLRMGAGSLDALNEAFQPEPLEGQSVEHVLLRLVNSCFRQGGVGLERKKRMGVAEGKSLRAAGLVNDRTRKGRADPVPDDEDDLISTSEQFDIDPVNKQPGSLAESLMMALASGFQPKTSQYTCAKLHHLVATLSDAMIRRFQISIDRSITAFIIPDSLQILKPDEIFVSFSTRLPVDPDTLCHIPHLEGPVLAFRSPCKLPTDVRKFNAVYRPELAHLKDCVVMSASSEFCARSPASYLGGGDYDGDTVQVFWDPALVEPFQNAPDEYAMVPDGFVSENFEREVLKVSEFLMALEVAGADEETRIANQQRYLLGAIEDDMAAEKYSNLHGSAIYELGLAHPETVHLARMFCHVLDARKSGLKVKPEVKSKDNQRHGYLVVWRNWKKDIEDTQNTMVCPRPAHMGPFILDLLMNANKAHRMRMMTSFPKTITFDSLANVDHRDLSRLWSRVQGRTEEEAGFFGHDGIEGTAPSSPLAADAARLEQHVRTCHSIWLQMWRGRLPRKPMTELYRTHHAALASGAAIPTTPSSRSRTGTAKRDDALLRLTQKRHLAQLWRDAPLPEDVPSLCFFGDKDTLRRIKVSCGATVEETPKKQLFVFDMDFEMACELKAKATGSTTMVLEDVFMSMKTGYKRQGE